MPRKSKNYIDIGWGIRLRTWLVLPIIFILLFLDRASAATKTESPQAPDLNLPYNPDIALPNNATTDKIELIIPPLLQPFNESLTDEQKAKLEDRKQRLFKRKEKTKKMVRNLRKACRAPVNEKLYFCENLETIIENGNKILNDQIKTDGRMAWREKDLNDPDISIIKNGLPFAVYTDPDSEEYCIQSFRLSLLNITTTINPDISTHLPSILKLRIDADSHLCGEALQPGFEAIPFDRDQEKANYLQLLDSFAKPKNTLHPIHMIHKTIIKLARNISSNDTDLKFAEAAKEIINNMIYNLTSPHSQIISRLNYFPKHLLIITCEETRMLYAEILHKEIIPALQALQMTARTSVFQIEGIVKDILRHKYPESRVADNRDESFEMLSHDTMQKIMDLIENKQFTLNYAMYLIANKIPTEQHLMYSDVRSHMQRCTPFPQKYISNSSIFMIRKEVRQCTENALSRFTDRFSDETLYDKRAIMLRQPPQPKINLNLPAMCLWSLIYWGGMLAIIAATRNQTRRYQLSFFNHRRESLEHSPLLNDSRIINIPSTQVVQKKGS